MGKSFVTAGWLQETLVHGHLGTGQPYEARLSDEEVGKVLDGWRPLDEFGGSGSLSAVRVCENEKQR